MKMSDTNKTNRLAQEKSPYLLQHAENPVDWYPWGEEAFARAREEDKPVFLSIGYSTCHWCHVMAHESFENDEVARILNENFISIKVDREERPDIDSTYMAVCQAMTGGGGWPLSVFMTPEKMPFFSGTYFPPEDTLISGSQMRGFKTIALALADTWNNKKEEILDAARKITQAVSSESKMASPVSSLSVGTLGKTFSMLNRAHDHQYGGFGTSGPKFPQTHMLSLLLRHWKNSGEANALEIVDNTLDHLDRGGIHDHVGGGFARYSTDNKWLVPHFEKMLYDQAIISRTFLEAYQATGNPRYADVARDIFDYVLRDMTHPEGGFYSAEDADSEGEEGKFYVWTKSEIDDLLGSDAELFNSFFGVSEHGNFEDGANILNIRLEPDKFLAMHNISSDDLKPVIERGLETLFKEREKRVRPHLDDKIIASWNGLMIASLAYGAHVLGEKRYSDAAAKAAYFVIDKMLVDGRLHRRYRDGETAVPAFLDDYAFFAYGLLELQRATFERGWIAEARKVTDAMLGLFHDSENGGFYYSADDNEKLISNRKDAYDGAEPSGNSIAALVLLRLGRLTMLPEYTKRGYETIATFADDIDRYPPGYTQMLIALDFYLGSSKEIVIAGSINDERTQRMIDAVREEFLPRSSFIHVDNGKVHTESQDSPEKERETFAEVGTYKAIDGIPTAYVCADYTCKQPTQSVDELKEFLKQ